MILRARITILLFFQKTLVSDHRQIKSLSDRWSGPSFWSPALGKQGGVCALFHPSFEGKFLSWRKDSSGRVLSFLIDFSGCQVNLLSIYAPTNPAERKSFLKTYMNFLSLQVILLSVAILMAMSAQ